MTNFVHIFYDYFLLLVGFGAFVCVTNEAGLSYSFLLTVRKTYPEEMCVFLFLTVLPLNMSCTGLHLDSDMVNRSG